MSLIGKRDVELVIGRGGGHFYRFAGEEKTYPSVTTVTGKVLNKPALVPWAKKMALESVRLELLEAMDRGHSALFEIQDIDDILERARIRPTEIAKEAADIGTRAHAAIDKLLKGISVRLEDDIRKPVEGFLRWHESCGIVLELSEHRLISEKLKIGGTLDCLGKKDGNRIVVDWKTSKGIWPEMAYQVGGGYVSLVEDGMGEEVAEAWIIRFPKFKDDPLPFEAKQVKDLSKAKAAFAACRALYDLMQEKMFND